MDRGRTSLDTDPCEDGSVIEAGGYRSGKYPSHLDPLPQPH